MWTLTILSAGSTAYAAEKGGSATIRLVINKRIAAVDPPPILVNREPHLPLRAVCEYLGGHVRWNAHTRQAEVLYKNKIVYFDGPSKDNRMMASASEVAEIFGLRYHYDPALSAVTLDKGDPPSQQQLLGLLPSYNGYNSEDLYWLSRIVEAEATGESYESRLAVASVILNRMNNQAYPDTIKAVIFDKKYGVQFTPVSNGSVYNEPSTQSFLAALDALEGRNNAPGALFFMNPRYATSFWMQDNREYAFTIGGHRYYY